MQQSQELEYEQLLQFVYACPVGLIDMTRDGDITLVNPLAMKLVMPLATDGILSNLLTVFQNCAPELRSLIQNFSSKRGTICENHRIYVGAKSKAHPDDPQILSCTIVKLKDERYIATLTDVSLQVRQERRLKEAETWFGSLLEGVKDFGVASLGIDGRVDAVNASLIRQTGYEESELKGMPLLALVNGSTTEATAATARRLGQAGRDGWHLEEGWSTRRDGERYWCQSLIAVCADEFSDSEHSVRGYTVIMREVERRDTDMLELQRLLRTDHLTGAYNRSAFFDAAEREHNRSQTTGRPLALITLDIDYFKSINDTYGHSVGDDVLRSISKICQEAVRPGDTFARIGGEEFTIILPETALNDAIDIAEHVRELIASTPVVVGEQRLNVTASFGCAEGPFSGGSANDILAAADRALYQAKRAGRNRTAPAKLMISAA